MVIRTVEEVEKIREVIRYNADVVFEQLKAKSENIEAVSFLKYIKFERVGLDPVEGTELNFIEQLNQTFSDLVVLEGVRHLLLEYPEKEWKLNLGSASGFDIESVDGEVVAECFAATVSTSNRKLDKDCLKLMDKATGQKKYICFYTHYDSDEKIQRIFNKYPEITFIRVTDF